MTTQEDRSLSSGMSLPQWMKTKMNDKLDFEQSAFSPTELDDSFMFYYNRNKNLRGTSEPPAQEVSVAPNNLEGSSAKAFTPPVNGQKPDFSKHTPFCQKYLTGNSIDSTSAQQVKYSSTTKTKSSGIDDGFKGEAAKCGASVIRVAHQMVSGKVVYGFNITNNDCDTPQDSPPKGFNPLARRDSKSLPASPLSSPKSSRRQVNKYFTGPFVDNESHQGSWILSNLLSKRQTLSQSVGYIPEDEPNELRKTTSNISIDADADKKKSIFLAKPSELREMNFWSPTSM